PLPEAWNRTNGRIYRLSWADTYTPRSVNLGVMSDVELARLHTHRSEWYVRTARRLLQERAARGDIAGAALEVLRAPSQDMGVDAVQRLRALWTLHVTEHLGTAELERALRDPEDVVRAWAITLGTERAGALVLSEETLVRHAREDTSSLDRKSTRLNSSH